MHLTALYVGTWELMPQLSLYEFGAPPTTGIYEIEGVEDGVHLRVGWTVLPDGPQQSTAFGGPVDGIPQALPPGPSDQAPDAFCLTHVDDRTLDSAALRAGTVIAYARRVASADGSLLAVVQEGIRPDGSRFRNFQVYRRREA